MSQPGTNPLTHHLAKHIRDVHTGGNWTYSNLKDQLKGVTVEEANTKLNSLNTIAALVYHIHYFVHAVLDVLHGKPLDAHDKFSFDHPEFKTQSDWDQFLINVFKEAEEFAGLVEKLPDEQMWMLFSGDKYGNWYRNIAGVIEHTHYHLGQIAIVKKMIREKKERESGRAGERVSGRAGETKRRNGD